MADYTYELWKVLAQIVELEDIRKQAEDPNTPSDVVDANLHEYNTFVRPTWNKARELLDEIEEGE